ncbi:hypothetical protein [Microbacterium ulmi]|uniref:Restriction endonuclease n=1 Tax=Microbacterium ulmi TaxID=179095 RepID=A0A7Y2M0X2_9MICO|nr:hypothetical protein [Microbacterium ulmi]NII68412.1 hypothetical protein [Microbacterium ulmi]NNH03063.1 hypothetical protein [Microbacterium ulmi]
METESEVLPWLARVGAVPTLPSPTGGWRDQLIRLLEWLNQSGPLPRDTTFANPGSATQYTLGQYANQLAPFDLLTRTPERQVEVGKFGREWLKDPAPDLLLRQIHARAKFVGELLSAIRDRPREMIELHDLANDEYGLDWRSRDQVRRRMTWLMSLGFAERLYNNFYAITDSGREVLSDLPLHVIDGHDESDQSARLPLPASGPAIEALVMTLAADPRIDEVRRRGLGYLPANPDSPVEKSIAALTELAVDPISIDGFVSKTRVTFDLSDSSAKSSLGTLRGCGLFEPTGRFTFVASTVAREWLESGSAIDLVRILHAKTFPVGEVIRLIDEANRAPALALAINARYGDGSTSALAVARILPFLLAVGAIREIGYARYASTALGRELADSLPLRRTAIDGMDESSTPAVAGEPRPTAEELAGELEAAGTRSEQPQRLERAVAAALNYLGATAKIVGGPGNTDVLAEIGTQPAERIVAIIDAKSSIHGVVSENAVKLDAIEEHKRKHGASLAAIVGPSFAGRLASWATDKQIALITTDFLASLVRRHATTPLGRADLQNLLEGHDGHEALIRSVSLQSATAGLVGIVLTVLLREAEENDPNVTAGLDLDGMYRAIRDQFAIKADKQDLRVAADLLASPLVAGVALRGNHYLAVEPATTIALRLSTLASSLEGINQVD